MKNKKYIISVIAAIIFIIILTVIIELLFNISIHYTDFILGWIGSSIYYIALIKINNNNKSNDDINNVIKNINNKLTILEKEKEFYKIELEDMKSKYDNFKSEMIEQQNIKY